MNLYLQFYNKASFIFLIFLYEAFCKMFTYVLINFFKEALIYENKCELILWKCETVTFNLIVSDPHLAQNLVIKAASY